MAATATMDELADDVNADGDDGNEVCAVQWGLHYIIHSRVLNTEPTKHYVQVFLS